jgi:hypothetical protein
MADDDTVITIDQDALSGLPSPKAPEPEPPPKTAEKTDDALAELKSQYDELQKVKTASDDAAARDRQARLSAEAEAQRARTEAHTARSESLDTQLSAIDDRILSAKAAADAAETELVSAQEAGDWKRVAQAQRKLSRAEAEGVELERAKTDWETRKAQTPQRSETDARQIPADPVEAFMASRTPTTQSWLRTHMEHTRAIGKFYAGQATAEEAKLARKLIAASSDAEAEGYAVDTPEYFSHLETFIAPKKPEPKAEAKPATPRRQSVPAAPVNGGSSPSASSGGPVNVRLTKGQAEAATDYSIVWNRGDVLAKRCTADQVGQPIGVHEMARRVYLMEQERPGIFTNGNVEQ